jgi:hypothetical protein
MGRLTAAAAGVGSALGAHLWLALAAVAVPVALVCATVVVLVLSVERGKRVEAIRALPPVVVALRGRSTKGSATTAEETLSIEYEQSGAGAKPSGQAPDGSQSPR